MKQTRLRAGLTKRRIARGRAKSAQWGWTVTAEVCKHGWDEHKFFGFLSVFSLPVFINIILATLFKRTSYLRLVHQSLSHGWFTNQY